MTKKKPYGKIKRERLHQLLAQGADFRTVHPDEIFEREAPPPRTDTISDWYKKNMLDRLTAPNPFLA